MTTPTTETESSGTDAEQLPTFIPPAGTDGEADGSNAETDEDSTDWKAEALSARAEVDHWRDKARVQEKRAKDNAAAASERKTLEQRVAEFEKREAERDERDRQRAGKLALEKVGRHVAQAGIGRDEVDGFLAKVDVAQLLDKQGEPDDKAITDFAASLVKLAGRPTPDPDQGKTSGAAKPSDMNAMIRRSAGYAR